MNLYILVKANECGIEVQDPIAADGIDEAIICFGNYPFSSEDFDGTNEETELKARERAKDFYNAKKESYYNATLQGNYIDGDSRSQYIIIEVPQTGKIEIFPQGGN